MTEEEQSINWQCLPKEVREEMRRTYKYQCPNIEYDRGFNEALEEIFGGHNLTSDTEPTELLFVERKKAQEYRAEADYACAGTFSSEYSKGYWRGQQTALDRLFGDKCLPDKEPSVQVEPRFKVGELIMSEGKVGRVLEYDSVREFPYLIHFPFNNSKDYRLESDLEPYTEPEVKRKETQELSHLDEQSVETKDAYEQYREAMAKESRKCDESELNDILYEKDGISLENESKIDEMMEEKELNLLELLKGCEDETFYSPALGTVWIHSINDEEIEIVGTSEDYAITVDGTGKWNLFFKTHVCILFPSKELYEKYPLDAAKAWQIWVEEGRPKHILQAQIRLISKDGKTVEGCEKVEMKVSDMDLTQAAEAVRKCLEEFHAKNTEP